MDWIRLARAAGGLLSVIALLVVLLYHVIDPTVTVSMWVVATLLSLIGALLAVDIGLDALPSEITIGFSDQGENNDK